MMNQHYPVNWINGMRINSGHFIELEDHVIARTQHYALTHIHALTYGLLPSGQARRGSPVFSLLPQQEKLKSLESFTVITPDGFLVPVPADYEYPLSKPETESSQYLLVLSAKPYARSPFGEINEQENPLRYPYTVPDCQFHLFPYPHKSKHTLGNCLVPLALYSGSSLEPDPAWIPPCTSLQSHPTLAELTEKLKVAFDELERKVIELLKKPNVTNKPLLVSMLHFFNEHKSAVDLYLPFHAPVFLVEKLQILARSVFYTADSQNIPLRDDQRSFLSELSSLAYDHLETGKSFQKVRAFIEQYNKLLPRDENVFGV